MFKELIEEGNIFSLPTWLWAVLVCLIELAFFMLCFWKVTKKDSWFSLKLISIMFGVGILFLFLIVGLLIEQLIRVINAKTLEWIGIIVLAFFGNWVVYQVIKSIKKVRRKK